MKRREFVAALTATAVSGPFAARAQQAMPVIGLLSSASSRDYGPMIAAFRKSLGEAGFVEAQNVKIECRWADEQYDRLPTLATDLIRRQVSVIVAATTPAALNCRLHSAGASRSRSTPMPRGKRPSTAALTRSARGMLARSSY